MALWSTNTAHRFLENTTNFPLTNKKTMATIYSFSEKIASLQKEKNYQEALDYFRANHSDFTIQQIGEQSTLVCDMLHCFRYAAHLENGYCFLQQYNIQINEQTPENVLLAYGWLIYDHYKSIHKQYASKTTHVTLEDLAESLDADAEFNTEDLASKTEEIIPLLLRFSSEWSCKLMEFLIKIVLKTEKQKSVPDWAFVVHFCEAIDPEKLSTNIVTVKVKRKEERKEIKMASTREEWYAYLSKALFETANYASCYDISKRALAHFKVFHQGYDLRFTEHIAWCKKEMENTEAAIDELEEMLKMKRDWFIRKVVAELYLEQGELEKAYAQAMLGISTYGNLELKVELIELLSKLLDEKGESKLAGQHYLLAHLIREENQWEIPAELEQKRNASQGISVYKLSNKKALLTELSIFWYKIDPNKKSKKTTQSTKPVEYTGIIKKLLPPTEEGTAGFITKDIGGEVFFFVHSNKQIYNLLREGTRVKFYTEPDKKGKGDRATKLRVI